jgi:hypothetical protein
VYDSPSDFVVGSSTWPTVAHAGISAQAIAPTLSARTAFAATTSAVVVYGGTVTVVKKLGFTPQTEGSKPFSPMTAMFWLTR